jgi:hypothetical protein
MVYGIDFLEKHGKNRELFERRFHFDPGRLASGESI